MTSYLIQQNRWRDRYYRADSQLKCLYLMVCLRPYHRVVSAKLRFLLFLMFLTLITIYLVKTLNTSTTSTPNLLVSNAFDDNLVHLRHELQYAVMVDAGSSGSRVHIYVWPPHTGDTRQLLQIRMLHNELGKDVYSQISPGLSSCASNPSSASEYMEPLLTFAAENIPKEKHKSTPLFILATAGMRLLPRQTQTAILDDLRSDIPKNFSFLLPSNHVEVITGKEEGIYSWISVNYLLGRFDHSIESGPMTSVEIKKNRIRRAQSISMLEMGGASVQIAFEITSNDQIDRLRERHPQEDLNDLISEFNLGCSEHDSEHSYRLFVTTYLGLGANVARSTYVNALLSSTMTANTDDTSLASKEILIYDPCLCIDSSERVNISRRTKNNNGSTLFLYHLKGSGDFNGCQLKLNEILDPRSEASRHCSTNRNASCPLTHLRDTEAPFDSTEFYGFSEFWYTADDILRLGGPYRSDKYRETASNYCSTSWSVTLDRFKRKLYPKGDPNRLLYQCFKSVWISSVLHNGFKMPKTYTKYRSASTINGESVQWTLGALLYRTRFFPLRTIEQQSGVTYARATGTTSSYVINYVLFIGCMTAVVICIVVYLKHLHRMVNNHTIHSIHSNNSLIDNNLESTLSHVVIDSNNESDLLAIEIPHESRPLIDSLSTNNR